MKILVTGASNGIGRAIAEALLLDGQSVVGTFHSDQSSATDLEKTYPNLKMHQADFSSRKSTQNLIDQIKNEKLTGIVNNAGIFKEDQLQALDIDKWDASFEVNVTAPLLIVSGLLPNLAPGSAIVNIASTDAYAGAYLGISYAASKAALMSLTKSLAVNLAAQKIRVNAIAPGWVNTNMGAEATGVDKEAIAKTPLGRNADPSEVADLALFLLSGKASFITGQIIDIDGGYGIVDEVLKREAEVSNQ